MQSVLDMRERQLEEVQQRFALQQREVVKFEQLIAEHRQKIDEMMIVNPNEPFDPTLSQQRFHYTQFLKTQMGLMLQQKQKEEKKLVLLREELRQAHIRKKTLELLKEKQRIAYIKNIQYQEEKELEDMVVARLHRTRDERNKRETAV